MNLIKHLDALESAVAEYNNAPTSMVIEDKNMETIKSVNSDQHQILSDIMALCNIDAIDLDVTYGNGSFYRSTIPEPIYKTDIQPLSEGVVQSDSGHLPFSEGAFKSMVFDPPFLTYIKQGREHGSVMAKRFGGYWAYSELENHYKRTIKEAGRVLEKKGTLIFKCQDIIHNHKMHPTHINVVNWSSSLFRLKDLFVLTAKHRLPNRGKQAHARIHQCYFLVLERNNTPYQEAV